MPDFFVGDSERYEIGDRRSGGATGDLFRARDRASGRAVAVKILAPGCATTTKRSAA
jgi:hypothetical protein